MASGSRISIVDLAVVTAMVAAASYIYFRPHADSTPPQIAASATARAPGNAPSFTLPRLEGEPLHFEGAGPALITLSAVGCVGCQERVPTDRQAYELAHKRRVPIWNVFVYAQGDGARAFKERFQPQADEYLYDTDGAVSVKTYGGSDSTCWILIDGQGNIIYRSGPNLDDLEKKLATLRDKP